MNNQNQNPRNNRPQDRPPQRPPQGQRPPQRHDARPAQQGRPMQRPPERPTQERPPVRIERRPEAVRSPKKQRTADDYLIWFLILAVVLLVAVVVTYIIIKVADDKPPKLPNDDPAESSSIQAGIVDPDNDTTASWAVVPSDVKAFAPKISNDTKTVSASAIYSEAAIVVDLSNMNAIASLSSTKKVYPASLTKVMTLIVACENIKNMKDTFTFTDELYAEIVNPLIDEGASRARFAKNTPIPLEDLIYGAALPSGGDACAALAIKLCGSVDKFVELMNAKAAAMGCTGTHFTNPTGLHDDNHYSTVKDLANIMAYAMNNPFIRQVLSTEKFDTKVPDEVGDDLVLTCIWKGRVYGNEADNSTMFAAKTGYTLEAGQCLASVSRTADGKEYIIVTAGARSENGGTKLFPFEDAKYISENYIK